VNTDQDKLRNVLNQANEAYRLTGQDSGLSDQEYDYLLDLIDDDSFKNKVGVEVEKNKIELAVPMGSLNKIKTYEEVTSWCERKEIPLSTEVCVTPKFDGLSLLVEFENGLYKSAATRGDGSTGQDVTEHFRYTTLGKVRLPDDFNGFLIGETIMREQTFADKHQSSFKNPRNMVAGLLSRKQISKELEDVNFIAFSVRNKSFVKKSEELKFCNDFVNRHFNYQLNIVTREVGTLAGDWLAELFASEKEFQCDGLVVEVDDVAFQNELGRETNSLNPVYARAWKPESDDNRPTKVLGILWQVSKNGSQKPVVQVEPVELGGVTISNVTGINAKFIMESGIAEGAVVSIIRSGDVIPKIINTILPVKGDVLPDCCVSCGGPIKWNDTHIELFCDNRECGERKVSENTDFFKVLEIDEVGEGIVKQFYEAGYKDISQILNLSTEEILKLDGFKEKKAVKVHRTIHAGLKNVELHKLQHASNLFRGLGSRKLKPLAMYSSQEMKPELEAVIAIDGYSDISANAYLEGFDLFWQWLESLPITVASYEAPKEGVYSGKTFVFTGFRSPELEAGIVNLGGKMGSSVSKNTYALVMKKKGSGSSKEKKALSLGALVYEKEELEAILSEL
jgi:DNA ligase (NAD+)